MFQFQIIYEGLSIFIIYPKNVIYGNKFRTISALI